MTVSSFMTVLVFVSCVLVTFLVNAVYSTECLFDSDCFRYGQDLCIRRTCYLRKGHGYSCEFDRQCFEPKERCFISYLGTSCDCEGNYNWKGNRCLENNKCDFNSDCDGI